MTTKVRVRAPQLPVFLKCPSNVFMKLYEETFNHFLFHIRFLEEVFRTTISNMNFSSSTEESGSSFVKLERVGKTVNNF